MVFVASARDLWELSGLVSVDGIFAFLCVFLLEQLLHITFFNEDVTFLSLRVCSVLTLSVVGPSWCALFWWTAHSVVVLTCAQIVSPQTQGNTC